MRIMGDFIYDSAKPLPVLLLLDTSGSMSIDNHIGTLNSCVRDMIHSFKEAETSEVAISLSVITFGDEPNIYQSLKDVSEISENAFNFNAYGMTPMGEAIELAKSMIEDKDQVPSRAYRPTVVLVSDGAPTDEWKSALNSFVNEGRSSKCYRMALGIGAGSSGHAYDVLKAFASREEFLFKAQDADQISKFFNFVTMSTTGRTVSANPNLIEAAPAPSEPDAGDDDISDLLPY